MIVRVVRARAPSGSVSGTQHHALTDGLLVVRYLAGLSGVALTQGALGGAAMRTDPVAIKAHLDAICPWLDIDDDGAFDPNTDGVLILRCMLGLPLRLPPMRRRCEAYPRCEQRPQTSRRICKA